MTDGEAGMREAHGMCRIETCSIARVLASLDQTRAALRYVWEHSGGDDRWEEKTRHKVRAALDGDPDPSDVLRFA